MAASTPRGTPAAPRTVAAPTLCRSVGWALSGLADLLRSQRHARIHFAATLAAGGLGWGLSLPASELALLALAAGLVWSLEALNTAVEVLADRVNPDHDPAIGRAKDLAAGAVLAGAIAAALVGLIVLGPPLWRAVRGLLA